ncbi:MAG TPA: hypothetical protein EYP24_03555 [bacterium (Candidatus Stahlbacteria)]|nr:hypothetical protein [Candidatus Stahlbacteria bacterium]
MGLAYYVDSHSIFRFVCHRRSFRYRQRLGTDEVMTQWRWVIEKCGMRVWHALSPQAKGKAERPYRWLQDRLVRRYAHERVTEIEPAREILHQALYLTAAL